MVDFFMQSMREGGNALERKYIESVKPLDDHILQVDFLSGSRLLLNMKPYLDSIRFRPLKSPLVWQSAATNGLFVHFENVELAEQGNPIMQQ